MLKDQRKIMPPPWMALPQIERGSMGWRMGEGEYYLERWAAWHGQLDKDDKAEYLRLFPEPAPWRGALTDAERCEALARGSLRVDAWRKKGMPKYTRAQLCDAFAAGETPPMEMFWGHHPSKDGRITKSCFSQWWTSAFFFHGRPMCCMEQCMMWGKAQVFEDEETARKILESDDPQKIKKLGRQVRNFDDQTWNEIKYSLVLNGNYNKFTHSDELRRFLLSTGDSVLVEASPYDCIWGIGLGADSDDAQDPRKWRGENLLGFALMEVRDEIRKVYANEALCRGAEA